MPCTPTRSEAIGTGAQPTQLRRSARLQQAACPHTCSQGYEQASATPPRGTRAANLARTSGAVSNATNKANFDQSTPVLFDSDDSEATVTSTESGDTVFDRSSGGGSAHSPGDENISFEKTPQHVATVKDVLLNPFTAEYAAEHLEPGYAAKQHTKCLAFYSTGRRNQLRKYRINREATLSRRSGGDTFASAAPDAAWFKDFGHESPCTRRIKFLEHEDSDSDN